MDCESPEFLWPDETLRSIGLKTQLVQFFSTSDQEEFYRAHLLTDYPGSRRVTVRR